MIVVFRQQQDERLKWLKEERTRGRDDYFRSKPRIDGEDRLRFDTLFICIDLAMISEPSNSVTKVLRSCFSFSICH